jgi:hypothetical protein
VDAEPYRVVLPPTMQTVDTILTCGECGYEIDGEKHEVFIGAWEEPTKSYQVHITCVDCLSIRDEFFCEMYCYGDVLSEVSDHVYDLSGEISSECLLALTPRAREMVLDMIDATFLMLDEEDEEDEDD